MPAGWIQHTTNAVPCMSEMLYATGEPAFFAAAHSETMLGCTDAEAPGRSAYRGTGWRRRQASPQNRAFCLRWESLSGHAVVCSLETTNLENFPSVSWMLQWVSFQIWSKALPPSVICNNRFCLIPYRCIQLIEINKNLSYQSSQYHFLKPS